MSALVLVLLAAPVVGAAVVFVVPACAGRLAPVVAAALAVGWVVVAGTGDPVTVGDLHVDGLVAAAAVGTAVLVAAARPRSSADAAASLLVLSVLPLAAALEPAPLPERRLALGIVVIAALAAVRLWRERAPGLGQAVAVLAAIVLATGLIGRSAGEAVALTVAGTTVAVVAAAVWVVPGRLLFPAALFAVARVAPLRDAPAGTDRVLLVVAGLLAVGAVALLAVRARPAVQRLPLAGVLAGAGLLATDVVELRSAGALLGAGAVLAVAGRHPLALLAMAPGVAAAVGAAGVASQPEHALVGVATVVVLVAGAVDRGAGRGATPGSPARAARWPLTAAAVVFAVVPAWGWAGADPRGYREAVAVAVAVAVPLLLAPVLRDARRLDLTGRRRTTEDLAAWVEDTGAGHPDSRSSPAGAGAATGAAAGGGSLVVRPPTGAPHGTALHDVESVPEEGHRNEVDDSSS